jgi:hypothetical protein
MTEYLDKEKILKGLKPMVECSSGKEKDAFEWVEAMICTNAWDPDPIILGDGSEARIGDKVQVTSFIDDDKECVLIAVDGKWAWVKNLREYHSDCNIACLRKWEEPDSWEDIADLIFKDLNKRHEESYARSIADSIVEIAKTLKENHKWPVQ